MDDSRFWQLIDRARHARGSFSVALRELLVELTDSELFGFQHQLERQLALSDRAELAAAAWLLLGSSSEHRFAAFRAWLIAQGPNAFSAALSDPDSLAELDWERAPELPELVSAASAAWRARTGRDDFLAALPDVETEEVPYGEADGFCVDGAPNATVLRARYPRIAAMLGRHATEPVSRRMPPRALTDLRSPDPSTRAQARAELCRVAEQLRSDDVAALVEQACEPGAPERAFLVRFIGDLCVPLSGQWAIGGFDLDAPRLVGYFDEAPALRERYEAVEAALPALLELLADPEAEVRSNATMTVSWFARSARRVRAALARAFPVERDTRVVASLLLALALQDHYLHDDASLGLMEANVAEPAPVGDAASIALYNYGDEPAAEAFDGITRLLGQRCCPVAGIPWNDGDLAALGVMALRERLPARASEVERLLFSVLERARGNLAPCHSVAAQALPVLLWLVSPREGSVNPEAPLDPRLRHLLEILAGAPSLATPSVRRALSSLGLPSGTEALALHVGPTAPPDEYAVDIALSMAGHPDERGMVAALELVRSAASESPVPAERRAQLLAAELATQPPPAQPVEADPVASRAALLVATSVLVAEKIGVEPDPVFDALADATLCAPALVPFFSRFLAVLGKPRQLRVLDELAARHFLPRWGCTPAVGLEELLATVLPRLGPEQREHALESCLDSNWRLVLKLSPEYPSRHVVSALLPRLADSLVDLGRWAPQALPQAVERDALALAEIGPEAEGALRSALNDSAEPTRRVAQRALEKLSGQG